MLRLCFVLILRAKLLGRERVRMIHRMFAGEQAHRGNVVRHQLNRSWCHVPDVSVSLLHESLTAETLGGSVPAESGLV